MAAEAWGQQARLQLGSQLEQSGGKRSVICVEIREPDRRFLDYCGPADTRVTSGLVSIAQFARAPNSALLGVQTSQRRQNTHSSRLMRNE